MTDPSESPRPRVSRGLALCGSKALDLTQLHLPPLQNGSHQLPRLSLGCKKGWERRVTATITPSLGDASSYGS